VAIVPLPEEFAVGVLGMVEPSTTFLKFLDFLPCCETMNDRVFLSSYRDGDLEFERAFA
jgi:hypothetical protein